MKKEQDNFDRVEVHPSGVKVYFKQDSDGQIYIKTVIPKHVPPKMAQLFIGIQGLLTSPKVS
jgi:hypothetical protein